MRGAFSLSRVTVAVTRHPEPFAALRVNSARDLPSVRASRSLVAALLGMTPKRKLLSPRLWREELSRTGNDPCRSAQIRGSITPSDERFASNRARVANYAALRLLAMALPGVLAFANRLGTRKEHDDVEDLSGNDRDAAGAQADHGGARG